MAHFEVLVEERFNKFADVAYVRLRYPLVDGLGRVVVKPLHHQLDVTRVVLVGAVQCDGGRVCGVHHSRDRVLRDPKTVGRVCEEVQIGY